MALVTESAAVSHVGKVRSNNQDSGYAGQSLFAVADGMGGHAGGDVASALALNKLLEIDGEYSSAVDAEFALQEAIVSANAILAEAVYEHPELTGMGTTLSALVRVGHSVALAHIGDSRIYRFRDGKLAQITTDHTFVQRLVDNGRITAEEAKVHPRRSVLMRVLGDVDSTPDVDLQVMDTRPGDRWLLCSDGLTGVVDNDQIAAALAENPSPQAVADVLVKESLDHGAPDNVTVVIVDISESFTGSTYIAQTVGAASRPIAFGGGSGRRSTRMPGLRLHPRVGPTQPSHFEAQSDDYLDELIDEDRRRSRRRKLTWLIGSIVVVLAIALGLFISYQWTQSRYFVGESNGHVAVYQGIQQSIGPISLSHVYQETTITVDNLPSYTKSQVQNTISADSIAAAQKVVQNLEQAAGNG
ncbi:MULTISPECIES: PP2C family protein-serine/threonine phosphatase [Subtercola]|uniref:Serine/threonine-protein phosphatase n=1 Tax=Subtercola vilae TaxID=2056433 RepID=A0A4T2C9F3_9MICO|nr:MULTISPECIES: PP2C family serine/threonine-protein phosphatase [Subtercola]MEA9985408.1 protein phosphatase 2C domain-containing protein [Subtercola sp. RTI3]TIH40850.1 serine/threonine-protein phosphatase [Subtercola vilae]